MPAQMPQDQYVKVGQIKTRFWALGDEGSVVILLHGIGDSIETWLPNINAIAEYHRAYAIDLVGYGHTDKPSVTYSGDYFAQFVKDFMETQNIDQATLVGNSMGGGVSLRFATKFPEKVDKLVLVNTFGLGKELSLIFRLVTLPIIGELLSRPSRKGTARLLRRCVYDPALVTNEWIERLYNLSALPGAQSSFLSTVRTSCNFAGARSELLEPLLAGLSSLPISTLVVWGQQDRIIPVTHARVAEKMMPNAKLHIFDPCGHLPHIERPEEFNELILKFLSM